MMRYIVFTLIGFFGPALVLLFMRLLWQWIRHQWLARKQAPEIIDVTPNDSRYPSRLLIASWLLLSLLFTGFLLWQLDKTSEQAPKHTYIPAHIDAEGNFVPAQIIEQEQ